ncbi:MAG TPA: GRAM domain-containing protein [Candidatus Mcinerneyibacterium sp.]|nr:GRAM domain-containing protein [Candidatus Mcinerneyibacterium sp.]
MKKNKYFLLGVYFGLILTVIYTLMTNLLVGLLMGIIAVPFFGLFMFLVFYIFKLRFEKEREKLGSKVLKDGPANHFNSIIAIGGWLFLTDDNLVYKSHSMNLKNNKFEIPLNEIKSLEKSKTFGFISNGLKIIIDDKEETFVVNEPEKWIEKIEKTIN